MPGPVVLNLNAHHQPVAPAVNGELAQGLGAQPELGVGNLLKGDAGVAHQVEQRLNQQALVGVNVRDAGIVVPNQAHPDLGGAVHRHSGDVLQGAMHVSSARCLSGLLGPNRLSTNSVKRSHSRMITLVYSASSGCFSSWSSNCAGAANAAQRVLHFVGKAEH